MISALLAATLLTATPQELIVASARKLIGTPYVFGGRSKSHGIDCQGLVFFAARAARACSWKSYSVYPTETVKHREFGPPVDGLSPVSTVDLDLSKLQPGDFVMLLAEVQNPAEPPLTTLGGQDMWVWHVGLYAGDGKWLNADPFAGAVQEQPLAAYLAEHEYSGVYVTRMKDGRPTPVKCR